MSQLKAFNSIGLCRVYVFELEVCQMSGSYS